MFGLLVPSTLSVSIVILSSSAVSSPASAGTHARSCSSQVAHDFVDFSPSLPFFVKPLVLHFSRAEAELSDAMAVDFSGKWLCTDIVGDMSELMTKNGAGWAARTAAKGMGYGKGRQTQDITQDGDVFSIVTGGVGPGKTTSFTVGGGNQEVDGPSGSVQVNPVWNGAELDMQPSNGTSMKRYMEGDWMVLELSHTGTVVKRKFTKQ